MRKSRVSVEVIRRKNTLEHILVQVSGRGLDRIDPYTKEIMLEAMCEHFFTSGGHPAKIVSNAVDKARKKNKRASGFVNAVLRKIVQNEKISTLLPAGESDQALSLIHSFPEWMIREVKTRFSEPESVLKALNRKPPFTVRLHPGRTDTAWNMFFDQGITLKPANLSYCCYMDTTEDITQTKAWAKGFAYIQDEASVIAADIACRNSRKSVLDLCAAPGGKITFIAQKKEDVKLTAADLPDRLDLLMENTERLCRGEISIVASDKIKGQFDTVLVDAPCSSLGIIRRHPDIKWNRRETDIESYAETQFSILQKAYSVLSPGGKIIYSVCTFTQAETEGVVNKLLATHDDLTTEHTEYKAAGKKLQFPGFIRPGFLNMDGFFLSIIRKK